MSTAKSIHLRRSWRENGVTHHSCVSACGLVVGGTGTLDLEKVTCEACKKTREYKERNTNGK